MTKFNGKKSIFLGSLRCDVDEATEKELHKHVIVSSKLRPDGIYIFRYGSGDIEIKTVSEVARGMCKEIYEKDGKEYPL